MSSCKTRDIPSSQTEQIEGTAVKPSYGFYSRALKEVFDTLDELKEAEAKHYAKVDAETKAKAEKTEDAKKVENAYKHLKEVEIKATKEIREAEQMYNKEKNAFIKKYGSYHMTYTNNNGEECLSVSDIVDSLWSAFGMPRLL